MMNRTKLLYARAGATAIAAALALSSTSVLAQDAQQAQPAPTDSTPPATIPAPAPTIDAAPAATDSSAAAPASTDATPAPVSTHKATKVARSTTLKRTIQTAAAKPAPMTTKTVSKTTVTRTPTKPAATPVTTAAAAPADQTAQSQVKPIVDVNNASVKTAQAKPMKKKDDTPIIAAGSALAFLAIGGAAVGLSRRKREDEEMMQDETMIDEPGQDAEPAVRDPIFEEEPPMIVPEVSAFAWDEPRTSGETDRRSGETWVERAYRGPSPDNPSLSLRKRLKRAAFFDKRDREVAAGEAQRVDADAGLPDALPAGRELELA